MLFYLIDIYIRYSIKDLVYFCFLLLSYLISVYYYYERFMVTAMIPLIITMSIYHFLICDAEIHINVKTASGKDRVSIVYNGADKKTITEMEVKLFNITNYNLNRGVRVELGKVPDDIFLKDPTRYGNLYEKYNWTPVTRKLQVKKSEIVDVINEDIVLKSHEHINNTTKTIQTNISMYEIVESGLSSFWSKDGLPEDDIVLNISYNFTGGRKSFKIKWRRDNFNAASLPFGVVRYGYVNINPGQRITKRLKGKKTIILMKIHYAASLVGSIVANYAHVYGKYHFWAPYVKDIMKAVSINNEVVTTELIQVRCYTDPVLEVRDSSTDELLPILTSRLPFHVRPKHRHAMKS